MPSEDKEWPYQRIFEAISDGMLLNDIETGIVVEVNPAAGAMHGYSREDFIGLRPAAYMHPDSHAQFSEWIRMAQAGLVFEATVVHISRDGVPFTVKVRGAACTYRERQYLVSVIHPVGAP